MIKGRVCSTVWELWKGAWGARVWPLRADASRYQGDLSDARYESADVTVRTLTAATQRPLSHVASGFTIHSAAPLPLRDIASRRWSIHFIWSSHHHTIISQRSKPTQPASTASEFWQRQWRADNDVSYRRRAVACSSPLVSSFYRSHKRNIGLIKADQTPDYSSILDRSLRLANSLPQIY